MTAVATQLMTKDGIRRTPRWISRINMIISIIGAAPMTSLR